MDISRTDCSHQVDICPGSICPGDICHISKFSAGTDPILMKLWMQLPGTIFSRCQPLCWYLSNQHMSWWHLSISRISQLLPTQFWPNLKGIFPKRILTSYFRTISIYPWFVELKIFLDPTFFWTHSFFGPKFCLNLNFWTKLFLDPNFFRIQHF